jgi:hypothetical protein
MIVEISLGRCSTVMSQVRESDRRFERVADDIVQHAGAFEPARCAQLAGPLRVDEDQHAQLFGLSQNG